MAGVLCGFASFSKGGTFVVTSGTCEVHDARDCATSVCVKSRIAPVAVVWSPHTWAHVRDPAESGYRQIHVYSTDTEGYACCWQLL